jgi:hypothetical protein
VFDNKAPFKLDDLRVPIPILAVLTASFFLFPFFFIFRLSLSNNTYRHNASTTRQLYALAFHLFLVVPLCLHLPLFDHHHQYPRGRRYYTKLRQSKGSAHVYKTALLLVEEGMISIG